MVLTQSVTRRGLMLLFTGSAMIAAAACGLLNSNYHYRYRMAVEVDTPEGLKTGSAVHEQIVGKSNVDVGELSGKRGIRTRGEAIAVDLPGGQTLFALIPDSQVAQAVLDPEWHNDWVESARRITSHQTPSNPLTMTPGRSAARLAKPAGYPLLVRFRDINDPKTIEEVDPNNLGASFGAGVHLRRITLQRTDDAVSKGIEKRLKWLSGYFDQSFSGKRFTNPHGPIVENLRAGSAMAALANRPLVFVNSNAPDSVRTVRSGNPSLL